MKPPEFLCSVDRTGRQNNTVSLKCLLPRLSSLELFTRLFFFFFCTLSPSLVLASSVCPHWHHQNAVKDSLREGEERMRDSASGGEEQVPGCFVGNTVKRSAVHGAPSAEHTSKPVLHLYCQHLGEERSEGGAAFEQRRVFTHSLSCRCSL